MNSLNEIMKNFFELTDGVFEVVRPELAFHHQEKYIPACQSKAIPMYQVQ